MDKSVPKGTALLLAFIYETETGKEAPECYEVIFGNRQSKLAKPITHMTLSDVQRSQKYWASSKWAARFGSKAFSSAAGAPQIMRATLRGLIKEIGLSGAEVYTPDMQDRLGYRLLCRRGYEDWIAGRIGDTQFAKNLACEWASFPVLVPTKGAHRTVQRGQSYYAGDGLNKALVSPEKIEALLAKVKAATAPQDPPKEAQEPVPVQPETGSVASTGQKTAFAAVAAFLVLAASWASGALHNLMEWTGGLFQ